MRESTFGMDPGLTLLMAVQRIIPLLNPNLKSCSEGSAGKSLEYTTPTIFLNHSAASYLLDATKFRGFCEQFG